MNLKDPNEEGKELEDGELEDVAGGGRKTGGDSGGGGGGGGGGKGGDDGGGSTDGDSAIDDVLDL